MKYCLIAILCTAAALFSSANAQTTKTLTLSSNGVVTLPTDFWAVNAAAISAALSLSGGGGGGSVNLTHGGVTYTLTLGDGPTPVLTLVPVE